MIRIFGPRAPPALCDLYDLDATIVVYDCSSWRIRFSHKGLQEVMQHSWKNSKQELCFCKLIAYARVKN